MRCFDQCVHLEVSDDIFLQAEADEKAFHQMYYGSPSNISLNLRRDYIGSIAQNTINEYLRAAVPTEVRVSTFYDRQRTKGDEGDFFLRGQSNDIKASPIGIDFPAVVRRSRLLVRGDSRHNVQWYTFAKVDVHQEIVHVVGVIQSDRFWEIAGEFAGKYPARYVLAEDLIPFSAYLYKTF